jgi:PPOX class probable F420-dependent enzyme
MTLKNVPESHANLLNDEVRAYAYLATIMPDGSPQLTPIWFNTDGEHLLFNSARGRVKDRNMRSRPQVAVVIHLQDNPLHYIQVRGAIVDFIEEGAREHINKLSLKYTGNPEFRIHDPDEIRVTYKLLPKSIQVMG